MFQKDLKAKLERIFQFKKTTFDAPSDKFEQDVLFIEVHEARSRVVEGNGGRTVAKVTGALVVFSQSNKFPYGYFTKQIAKAAPKDTKDFFFFDFDFDNPQSPARFQNIHERRTNFVFLFDSQFDPDKGTLTDLTLTIG